MADGYGFGGEGDWKTAALVRAAKVMSAGLDGGSSFMEDYTYDFAPNDGRVLGAHMLEVCPSIADGRPSCEIHPLSIGGRGDPVRLVFTARTGPAVNIALVDLGDRFRLLLNEVELVHPAEALPKLPVARALWRPKPDLSTSAEAWLLAGGPHHTVLSDQLDSEIVADFADIAGVELVAIDADTRMRDFTRELRWNQAYSQPQAEAIQLGGTGASFSEEAFALPVLNQREFPLRGYRSGEPVLTGHRASLATLEWRIPVSDVDRHLMVPPVGVNRISMSVFTEAGAAWDNAPQHWYKSAGVELLYEARVGYLLGAQLRIGVAKGFEVPGRTEAYVRLGRSF